MYGKFIGDVYYPDKEEIVSNERFNPIGTMFKLTKEDSLLVACVACGKPYQLLDIMLGELEEDHCPTCGTHAVAYWKGKPHRKVCCDAKAN